MGQIWPKHNIRVKHGLSASWKDDRLQNVYARGQTNQTKQKPAVKATYRKYLLLSALVPFVSL